VAKYHRNQHRVAWSGPAFDGFRVALVSERHYSGYLRLVRLERVVRLVNELVTDLIALTGDLASEPRNATYLAGRGQADGWATAYVCKLPVNDPLALAQQLDMQRSASLTQSARPTVVIAVGANAEPRTSRGRIGI
jgi:hypothetical protein